MVPAERALQGEGVLRLGDRCLRTAGASGGPPRRRTTARTAPASPPLRVTIGMARQLGLGGVELAGGSQDLGQLEQVVGDRRLAVGGVAAAVPLAEARPAQRRERVATVEGGAAGQGGAKVGEGRVVVVVMRNAASAWRYQPMATS